MKKDIHIGIGDSITTAKGFIDAWKKAEKNDKVETEHTRSIVLKQTVNKKTLWDLRSLCEI